MAQKVRILIYEGDDEWLETQLSRSLFKNVGDGDCRIFPKGTISAYDVKEGMVSKLMEAVNA